ncbi:hypothetical protein SAMN02787073_4976 [Chryseobacterium vrystaatense]|uniref:Uncharacterized protein n=1 Tax=Chryseobacterium vrystaatense TaxID=307480 RepID=A0A1M5NGT7_9FLAO|nr:hypothetical protein SAMN02787073_4976 [Chryseobacterium vrystaatense]
MTEFLIFRNICLYIPAIWLYNHPAFQEELSCRGSLLIRCCPEKNNSGRFLSDPVLLCASSVLIRIVFRFPKPVHYINELFYSVFYNFLKRIVHTYAEYPSAVGPKCDFIDIFVIFVCSSRKKLPRLTVC